MFGPRGLGKSSLSGELLAAALDPDGPLFEAGGESILLAGSLDQARPSSGSCGPRMTVPTSGIWTPGSAWPLRTFPTHTRVTGGVERCQARVRVRGRAARLIVGDEPASWQERGGALMYDALETSGGKNETTRTDRYSGRRLRRKAGGAHLLTTGSPGVDGLTIDDTATYLREHWPTIRAQLLTGTYTPQPVKRVDIPKPGGGVRRLGVPCVVDRLIQQALLQVLQGQWDPTFSEHSYGFRPGRSA